MQVFIPEMYASYWNFLKENFNGSNWTIDEALYNKSTYSLLPFMPIETVEMLIETLLNNPHDFLKEYEEQTAKYRFFKISKRKDKLITDPIHCVVLMMHLLENPQDDYAMTLLDNERQCGFVNKSGRRCRRYSSINKRCGHHQVKLLAEGETTPIDPETMRMLLSIKIPKRK